MCRPARSRPIGLGRLSSAMATTGTRVPMKIGGEGLNCRPRLVKTNNAAVRTTPKPDNAHITPAAFVRGRKTTGCSSAATARVYPLPFGPDPVGTVIQEGRMPKKFLLSESDIPERWYNILPDLPAPPFPYLHPATLQPMGPADLAPIFPQAIIAQEVSAEPWIEIPDQVREIYRIWRPSPLYRAERLEKALDTPAHIYFKYEGGSPAGSHKPNTAVPQAYYNSKEGVKRLTTETGAGQWGSALAFAGALFGLEVTVYMVKVSYEQKPYRRAMMETWGATVHASPTTLTNAGRGILADDPDSPGSLGVAISEAVADAATHDDAKYSLGSVVNHVLLHQTVIGLEAKKQMEMAGAYPDVVIGCVGGGSNFAGLTYPFIGDKLKGKHPKTRFIAAEPAACPTLTRGVYAYDFGDAVGLGPVVKMFPPGHSL